MYYAYRGIGIFVLSLTLVGGCFEQTTGNDYGTDEGTGEGDDGGTAGDSGGDDGGGDDGSGGTGTGGGGTGNTGGETSGTGGTDGGGTTGAGTGSTGGNDVVECTADPPIFPEFDKQCGNVGECAMVFHTIDCCGTEVVWGINENEVDRFDAAEEICDAQYPACGCPAGPTTAEDGNTGFGPDDFEIECTDGTCKSYVP
jgi:hypothetical protein